MRILTMPGPEDMVLDDRAENPRLIVSCCQRRIFQKNHIPNAPDYGFGYINLETDEFKAFDILPKDSKIEVRPHGIDILFEAGNRYLYAISHKGERSGPDQIVIRYKINGQSLTEEKVFSSDLLVSPNDLAVLGDGSFYCTNDSTKSTIIGRRLDQARRGESSNVVYYDVQTDSWKIVEKNLPFANGIYVNDKNIYVSCNKGNKLLKFTINLNRDLEWNDEFDVPKGMDNISSPNGNDLFIPVHKNAFKFLLHMIGRTKSPTEVYKVNVLNKNVDSIYPKKGMELINAGSTAISYNSHLYISQVFDGYVLKIPYTSTEL